jgi:diguanylate cyclase (GGDEF)-like protein/PAS domain S-box-containing protein
MLNKIFTTGAPILAIVAGCLVLLGWQLDIAILKGAIWQFPAIAPLIAFSFILAGISLLLLKSQPKHWHITLGRISGLAVAIICGLALTEFFIFEGGIFDPFTTWSNYFSLANAKTSPYAATSLLLIGSALFLLDFTTRRGHYPAQWLALGAVLIEIYMITAFSYGIVPFDNVFHSDVKPHSALIIILLGFGTLSARRQPQSLITSLESADPGALMLRQLLPFVVMGPMVLGWLKIFGQHAGLFTKSSGEAFVAIAATSIFSILLWRVAQKLKVLDIQRTETETLLHNTLETAPDGIIVCNDKHKILLINEQTEKMFGYARSELLGKAVEVLIPDLLRGTHTLTRSYVQQSSMQSMEQGLDITACRKDGSFFPVEIALSSHQHRSKLVITAVVRDISKRRQNEATIKRQQRALAMLSKSNRTLLHSVEADEAQLLHAMCQVVIKVGGFRMAWVGYKIDDEQKSVRPMAQAGFERGYLERAAISWGENERGQGPAGVALRTGQKQIVRNFATDHRMAPWREDALKRGYNSVIALPLKNKQEVFGTLAIYAEASDAFDKMEVSILDEMADDLSFGIFALRNNVMQIKMEEDLKSSYAMLESTLESTADGIIVTSLTGDILRYNQRFADMWGITIPIENLIHCDQLVSHLCSQVINAHGFVERTRGMYVTPSAAFKDVIELKDGRIIERTCQPHYMDEEVIGRVCSLHDITEQRIHESRLTYLANHDALTGLPNRNVLNDRLLQAVSHAARSDEQIALLFLDLDRFKLINDSLGHGFGDHVLLEVAKRITECLREVDTVARMGGDEFVILLQGLKREEDVAMVAVKILEAITAPCSINDRELQLEASIGIALYPRDGDDVDTLLRRADVAMYRAKDHGGNVFRFYEIEVDAQVNRHLEISEQLQNAIDRNEFLVYYQPQFDVKKGKVVGAEALIRWQHPTMGMISPVEFIPIAEESSMILKIGEWVAETVIKQCKAWQSEGLPLLSVAINIAARQFDYSDLPHILSNLLSKYDMDSTAFTLELELTEGMLMKHPEQVIQTLSTLKAMNFSISIDDFGTGYSSLAYLKRFPIDKLKIDRSFVKDTPEDLDDVAIASAIIVMAHELGMKVVAEGVETEAQFALLKARGCDVIQGYLTGRPMAAEEFEALLRSID